MAKNSQVENKQLINLFSCAAQDGVLKIHFSVNCIGRLNCVHQRYLIHITLGPHIQLGRAFGEKTLLLQFAVHLMNKNLLYNGKLSLNTLKTLLPISWLKV